MRDRLPSGSTTNNNGTPRRVSPLITARRHPWKGWRLRVITTEVGTSWEWVVCGVFVQFGEPGLARPLRRASRRADKRIVRLIQKGLKAGVLEDGVVTTSDRGTGQGSVISPLLANIYLHYVFDLWADRWRRCEATGDMIIVRYADDITPGLDPGAGFEHESDARRFWEAMRERLGKFALSLHPEKTRLIEFGRHAAANRERRGMGKPETFAFLGFTFICGKSRKGLFQIKRKPRADRMRAKLKEVKEGLRQRMHRTIADQGRWLGQVVAGYFNYFAVPTNDRAPGAFRHWVTDLWRRTLRRRSQKDRTPWDRMDQLEREFLPKPRVPPPLAQPPFRRQTPEVGAVCGQAARTDLCGGRAVMRVPTAIDTPDQIRGSG